MGLFLSSFAPLSFFPIPIAVHLSLAFFCPPLPGAHPLERCAVGAAKLYVVHFKLKRAFLVIAIVNLFVKQADKLERELGMGSSYT